MANDRLFLRCLGCGAVLLAYKYYMAGGYAADSDKATIWIERHLVCSDQAGRTVIDGEKEPFDLCWESRMSEEELNRAIRARDRARRQGGHWVRAG